MNIKQNDWHLLFPEDYDKVFDVLSQKYPKLFIRDKSFIFKKGIHRDIFNNGGFDFNRTVVRKFLQLCIEKKEYRDLHIDNTPRYDLEGNKVGIVTKEDVELYAKTQEEIRKRIEQKQSNKLAREKNLAKISDKSVKLKSTNTNYSKPKLGLKI
jgi:sRNA-binding protein